MKSSSYIGIRFFILSTTSSYKNDSAIGLLEKSSIFKYKSSSSFISFDLNFAIIPRSKFDSYCFSVAFIFSLLKLSCTNKSGKLSNFKYGCLY